MNCVKIEEFDPLITNACQNDFDNSSPEIADEIDDQITVEEHEEEISGINKHDDLKQHNYCVRQSIKGNGKNLQMDNENLIDGQKRLCLVCGDVASGYHYGVASCEACKAFFKRTIQGNIEYSCPALSNCEITKRRRKACQACRFQKCLHMGMLREGVRLDRVRGGRQKYKRVGDFVMPIFSAVKRSCPNTSNSTNSNNNNNNPISVNIDSEANRMLAALNAIEPDKVFAVPDPSLPDGEYKMNVTLSDLADRELVATIGWAKQVPGFTNLPLADQMTLLQTTWLDIICFNLAYRSSPYKGVLVYAEDFKVNETEVNRFSVPIEFDNSARRLSTKITELKMSKEEYMLIKAMLLLNPDLSTLETSATVQQLRDRMHDSLMDYEKGRQQNPSKRISHLLFCLPLLMHEKLLAMQYWIMIKKQATVPLHKLLSEMLEFVSMS